MDLFYLKKYFRFVKKQSMNIEVKILEIATYTLPAIITGGVAFGLLQKFFKNEENKRKFELLRENQRLGLPIRLQAYERIVLFLERINPINLMMRVEPNSLDPQSYATLLVHTIQTEYEHNIAQQIYFTQESWEIILKAKNSIITQIRRFSIEGEVASGEELRTKLLQELTQTESASAVAISFIKEELKRVF
jgi:paraquat-inducible protein B